MMIEEYIAGVRKASPIIFKWFMSRISEGPHSEEWWRDTITGARLLQDEFMDSAAINYATEYIQATVTALELIEKNQKGLIKSDDYLGDFSREDFNKLLDRYIGDSMVRVKKKGNEIYFFPIKYVK